MRWAFLKRRSRGGLPARCRFETRGLAPPSLAEPWRKRLRIVGFIVALSRVPAAPQITVVPPLAPAWSAQVSERPTYGCAVGGRALRPLGRLNFGSADGRLHVWRSGRLRPLVCLSFGACDGRQCGWRSGRLHPLGCLIFGAPDGRLHVWRSGILPPLWRSGISPLIELAR